MIAIWQENAAEFGDGALPPDEIAFIREAQPWRMPTASMNSATISTALGAFIPVLPFFFLTGIPALGTSFVISTLAHFVVGASKVIVTGRSWWKSGAEMTVVGLGEATITYIIGLWIAPMVG